jgi:hypothetical protein
VQGLSVREIPRAQFCSMLAEMTLPKSEFESGDVRRLACLEIKGGNERVDYSVEMLQRRQTADGQARPLGDTDAKGSRSGFRLNPDLAAMLSNDSHRCIEPKAGSFADALRGEEWFEDVQFLSCCLRFPLRGRADPETWVATRAILRPVSGRVGKERLGSLAQDRVGRASPASNRVRALSATKSSSSVEVARYLPEVAS